MQMCCKVSFGVDEARAFLSVPLLCLQQRYAEKQVRQAQEQLDETRERLDSHADTLNYAAHCAQWQAGGAAQVWVSFRFILPLRISLLSMMYTYM